jgi:hypothetical protein
MRRLLPLLLVLTACGAVSGAATVASRNATAPPTPARTPGTPTTILGGPAQRSLLDFSRPIQAVQTCGDLMQGASLASSIKGARGGAAVVSITDIGPAHWDTPTGARPTVQEASQPQTTPLWIYTAYRLHVERLLGTTSVLAVGQDVTGYLSGGRLGQDSTIGCIPNPAPHPAMAAVVIFGGPFPDRSDPGSIIDELDPIEGGQAMTLEGPQPIP